MHDMGDNRGAGVRTVSPGEGPFHQLFLLVLFIKGELPEWRVNYCTVAPDFYEWGQFGSIYLIARCPHLI